MSIRSLGIIGILAAVLTSSGCTDLATSVNPTRVDNGKTTTISAKLTQAGQPLSKRKVKFELLNAEICGTLGDAPNAISADADTDETGRAKVKFTAAPDVENCVARIRVATEGKTAVVAVRVRPVPAEVGRIDGVSALALVLIASFAIDRITRGILFLLSFWRAWATRFPDPESHARAELKKRYRLLYLVIAGTLSTLVLAWYGKIRLFAAMGFPGIQPLLDALLTGLLLVGGADRTEAILKSLGGGGEAGAATQTPLHITGTLNLVEREADQGAGAAPSEPRT